jgi:hypothetical protein
VILAIARRIVDAIRPYPIAHGHVGTANQELADLSARHIPAFIINETNLGARRNPDDRTRA